MLIKYLIANCIAILNTPLDLLKQIRKIIKHRYRICSTVKHMLIYVFSSLGCFQNKFIPYNF